MTEFFKVFVAGVASVSESRADGEEHGPSAVHRVLRGQTGQLQYVVVCCVVRSVLSFYSCSVLERMIQLSSDLLFEDCNYR